MNVSVMKSGMNSGMNSGMTNASLRMAGGLFFISCAFASAFSPAVAVEISPSLDPAPRIQPLVPGVENPASLTPSDRLQRRLESLVRERDQRIRELMDQRQHLRPATAAPENPALEEPLRERDQAHLDLRRALENYDERVVGHHRDTLDVTRPAAQAAQRSNLAATNQLRIAECYHDLAAAMTPPVADITAGFAALELIEIAELGDGEPVRYRYLRAWFLIEKARQASGEARTKLLAEATTAVDRLAQDHATSELVGAARGLLAGLNIAGTAGAVAP